MNIPVKLSDIMPVRVLTVDVDEEAHSNYYDELVRRACIESHRAEQEELEKHFRKARN
jgi:hypothetical protein